MIARLPLRLTAGALSLALGLATACTHAPDRAEGYGTRAPREQPSVADVPVHGYRARLRFEDGERLVGELLVAEPEPDGVVIVRTRKHGDQTRPSATIERAQIRTDPKIAAWMGGIGGATAVLIPLTLATGWYFVVLMPIVAVGGAVALTVAWVEGRVILTDDELALLYQYARWPQGRPESDGASAGGG